MAIDATRVASVASLAAKKNAPNLSSLRTLRTPTTSPTVLGVASAKKDPFGHQITKPVLTVSF